MGRNIPYATVAPTPPTAASGKLGFGKFVVDAALLSETKYGFEVDHTKWPSSSFPLICSNEQLPRS